MTRYIQVQPCRHGYSGIDRCATDEARFFGVYMGEPGDYDWVADLVCRDDAINYAKMLCEQHGAELVDMTQ